MNLMIHLPRFLCVYNYFCFAGIVVETNCAPPILEEMVVFLLYECVHPVHLLYVLVFLLPVQLLWQSNDLVLDPQGRWIVLSSWNNPLMVFGLHECRPIYRLEASAVKAMRPILTREFTFSLILWFCTLLRSQYWTFNIPVRCSRFFPVTSTVVSE